jgi:hypothetical protein
MERIKAQHGTSAKQQPMSRWTGGRALSAVVLLAQLAGCSGTGGDVAATRLTNSPGSAALVGLSADAGTALTRASCDERPRPGCRFVNFPVALDTEQRIVPGEAKPYFLTRGELGFVDSSGREWQAPLATMTDGASIPQMFIPMIGDRLSDEFLQAAIIHDAYCGSGNEKLPVYQSLPWEDVHRMFYDAMIVNGTSPVKAKIMFAAVYLGGPRWNDPGRKLDTVSTERKKQELEWCIRFIEGANPSRERIVEWMTSREPVMKAPVHAEPDWNTLLPQPGSR